MSFLLELLKTSVEKYGNVNPVIAMILLSREEIKGFIFGGFLRDFLRGKKSNDVDVALFGTEWDDVALFGTEWDEEKKSNEDVMLEKIENIFSDAQKKYGNDCDFEVHSKQITKNYSFGDRENIKYTLSFGGFEFVLDISFYSEETDFFRNDNPESYQSSLYIEKKTDIINLPINVDPRTWRYHVDNIFHEFNTFAENNTKVYFPKITTDPKSSFIEKSTDNILKDLRENVIEIISVNTVKKIYRICRFLNDGWILKYTNNVQYYCDEIDDVVKYGCISINEKKMINQLEDLIINLY
jgi:hypothetical protein